MKYLSQAYRAKDASSIQGNAVNTISQGGAIIFRTDGGVLRILVARAKKDAQNWIFPKGHLLSGESHAAGALRETFEETGVQGVVVGLVGPSSTFQSGDERVTVEYYLVEMVTEGASGERDIQWLPPAQALEALTFQDARDLLRTALPLLERLAQSPTATRFDELILREYEHLGESFLANEDSGEKRATFFIALCGAVGAGLGFVLGKAEFALPQQLLVCVTLAILSLLGYTTFVRVIVRNAASDRYKNQLSRIRQYFLDGQDDPRIAHLPFHPYEITRRRTHRKTRWQIGKGGWAETVGLIEALLGGLLVAFSAWQLIESHRGWRVAVTIALGIGAACTVWFLLFQRAEALYDTELEKGRDGSVPLRG
jgi:8-oxo-dGTP pyrophosphatase MutT (NUDIX family)